MGLVWGVCCMLPPLKKSAFFPVFQVDMSGVGKQSVSNRYTENPTTKTMKHTTIATMAALLLGSAGLYAQGTGTTVAYTKPSGFVTHTLKAGKFNLIGLTLHEPIAISGSLDTVSGTTLTDNSVDFTSVLTAGKTYILEIIENPADPSMVGTIQEITSWTATTLTTPQDLGADGLAGETASGANDGAKYQLREVRSLHDIFGADNSAGLKASTNISGADVIWLVNGSNGFDKYYYSPGGGLGGGTPGWKNVSGDDAGNPPIVYSDAIFVQSRSAEDINLVITGAVKVSGTALALTTGFNFVSTTFPVGATLENSGLEVDLKKATNIASADVVWIPNGSGGYTKYFYSPGGGLGGGMPGWKDASGSDVTNVSLTSGIIIQRRGNPVNVKITPPADYNNL